MNHETPRDPADAERIQYELRQHLILPAAGSPPPATVTGVDISYAIGSEHAVAAAVTINVDDLRVREVSLAIGTVDFPYVPGLLAFRELPLLLAAIGGLPAKPETLGRAVRTQNGVKPVYVSVGHRISLPDATGLTVRLSSRFRIPEPTRQADIVSRRELRRGPT